MLPGQLPRTDFCRDRAAFILRVLHGNNTVFSLEEMHEQLVNLTATSFTSRMQLHIRSACKSGGYVNRSTCIDSVRQKQAQ